VEEEETVVYIEGGIEGERAPFGCCILAKKSSILRFAVAVFFSPGSVRTGRAVFSVEGFQGRLG